MCPNVWYTLLKSLNIKCDGIRGQIRKYRSMYNLIIFINSQGPLQHYIKFSENFTVVFLFLQPLEFDFWAKFPNRPLRNPFFSAQRVSVQNPQSTKAVKVLKTGINTLTRRVWVGKILHNIRLKIHCRRSATSKAWELSSISFIFGDLRNLNHITPF